MWFVIYGSSVSPLPEAVDFPLIFSYAVNIGIAASIIEEKGVISNDYYQKTSSNIEIRLQTQKCHFSQAQKA